MEMEFKKEEKENTTKWNKINASIYKNSATYKNT